MNIVGQDKIINKINGCTLDTLPKTLMLVGEFGAGKHSICSYIAERFNLRLFDITDNLSLELIEEINSRVEPYLYLINGDKITDKDENCILKFLEEPLKNSYIIFICENTSGILPTVVNRCQIWELQGYSFYQLKEMFPTVDPIMWEINHTPGQIMQYANLPFHEMLDLATKILTKIGNANFANILTLSGKFAFKGESDKYNIHIFSQLLLYSALKLVQSSPAPQYVTIYHLTNNFIKTLHIKNIDCRNAFEHYLTQLRNYVRGDEKV